MEGGKGVVGAPRPPINECGRIGAEGLPYGWYLEDAAAWADAVACAACTAEAIAIAEAIADDDVVGGGDNWLLLEDAARAACIWSAANALVEEPFVDWDKWG